MSACCVKKRTGIGDFFGFSSFGESGFGEREKRLSLNGFEREFRETSAHREVHD